MKLSLRAAGGGEAIQRAALDCFATLAMTLVLFFSAPVFSADTITVGGKKFTEGYILSELFAQLIEGNTGYTVDRKFGLGGTTVCFEAIKTGAIDLYPEYTGTAQEVLLKSKSPTDVADLNRAMRQRFALAVGPSLGFNNTYALAVRADTAAKGIRTISDLARHPELRFGLSHEFLQREDGWPAVAATYRLQPQQLAGLDHGLAYEALRDGATDVIDAYSTDAKIARYHLVVLDDDRHLFPHYFAVPIVRMATLERYPELLPLFNRLEGSIDNETMRRLNAAVELDGKAIAVVAREFLTERGLVAASAQRSAAQRTIPTLLREHLLLTGIALFFAIVVGVPLGIALARAARFATPVLAFVGLLQTIPSIALLAFMIPLFGIGTRPAIVALFLYGLLPIVRNTFVGIREVSPTLTEVADGIGLTTLQRLRLIELPLAARTILAGIKTSAVINIGTATLAAFIGAGGLGEPIVTGLALNDTPMILRGAIPAALLAIATEYGFILIDRWVVPRGLRHA